MHAEKAARFAALAPAPSPEELELASKRAELEAKAAKITNANWRSGWRPTGSRPPKEPCIYLGVPKGSGPVAELKRSRGEDPREWAYIRVPGDRSIGGRDPWVTSGPGYTRTGRAFEWACGCITVYSRGIQHCKSGHSAGGDHHGVEWCFACGELHAEIYGAYALRTPDMQLGGIGHDDKDFPGAK